MVLYFRIFPSFRIILEKSPAIFWEMVSLKSKIFREFLGIWAWWSFCACGGFLIEIPGICGGFCAGAFLVKIPGVYEVFVRPEISNYVFGNLRVFCRFGFFSMIIRASVGKKKIGCSKNLSIF